MLLGSRVRFLNGQPGVIGGEKLDAGERLHPMEKLFIDVGATSREDCPVQVGDMAIFDRPFVDLGDRLVSKAMDDRVAVAILIETLRQLKDTPNEVYFVFSTQEEVGPRGAGTAAYGIDPELGVAVDVTRSGDTPRGVRMATCLGGPAIKVRDSGMLADPRGALDGSRREEARDPLPDGSAGSRLQPTPWSFRWPAPGCPRAACRSPAAIFTARLRWWTTGMCRTPCLLVALLSEPIELK